MKKIEIMERYIKPETKIVNVNIESLLETASFSTSDTGTGNAWDTGLSKKNKGSNLWELDSDEIDEEENN